MNRKTFIAKCKAFNAMMKADRGQIIELIQKEVVEYQKMVTDIALAMVPAVVDTAAALGSIAESWAVVAEDAEARTEEWEKGVMARMEVADKAINARLDSFGWNESDAEETVSE